MIDKIRKIMVLAFILMVVSFSFATTYTSSLTISNNSSVTGANRTYDAGNMKIAIRFSQLYNPSLSNNMLVACHKKTFFGYEEVGSNTKNYPLNSTVSSSFGSQVKGTYYYYFHTWQLNSSGGYANYVQMGDF